jgi:hypothetical protein
MLYQTIGNPLFYSCDNLFVRPGCLMGIIGKAELLQLSPPLLVNTKTTHNSSSPTGFLTPIISSFVSEHRYHTVWKWFSGANVRGIPSSSVARQGVQWCQILAVTLRPHRLHCWQRGGREAGNQFNNMHKYNPTARYHRESCSIKDVLVRSHFSLVCLNWGRTGWYECLDRRGRK